MVTREDHTTRLIPLSQWNLYHPWPTKQSLYNRVANEPEFVAACIIRVGRRLLIDERRFISWAKTGPGPSSRGPRSE